MDLKLTFGIFLINSALLRFIIIANVVKPDQQSPSHKLQMNFECNLNTFSSVKHDCIKVVVSFELQTYSQGPHQSHQLVNALHFSA